MTQKLLEGKTLDLLQMAKCQALSDLAKKANSQKWSN